MTIDHDRKREAGELIAKHQFSAVEDTRHAVNGGIDPGRLRTRMVERGERAADLETYDDDDEVEKMIARVKKQHAAMEAASGALDDELFFTSETQADNLN